MEAEEKDYFVGAVHQAHEVEPATRPTVCETYSVNPLAEDEWLVPIDTNGYLIPYKIDTGAQVNILSQADYQQLQQKSQLHPSIVKLSAYNGSAIPVAGKSVLNLHYKGKSYSVLFIIVDIDATPILGLATCSLLNLIRRVIQINDSMHTLMTGKFKNCFGEIRKLSGVHHITIDPAVPPVIHPPRKLAIALREKLDQELQRMVKMGIITPVHEPTDWVNSLVVVEKPNGKLRICLDPKDLNKAIKRHHVHLPTTEEILASMSNARLFTKLDASNAY